MKKRMHQVRQLAHRVDYTLYELAYPKPRNNPIYLFMCETASIFMLICVLILAKHIPAIADSGEYHIIGSSGVGTAITSDTTEMMEETVQDSGLVENEEEKLEMDLNYPQEVHSPIVTVGVQIQEYTAHNLTSSYGPGVQMLPDGMEEITSTTVYIAYTGEVNKRSQPSTDSEVIGTYAYQDAVEVVAKGNGWYKTADGGYIYENAVTFEKPPTMVYMGAFKITAYCNCRKCCGKNAVHGLTRTGTVPQENHTISVDPRVIPLGSKVMINGQIYIAEDTGSAIKGNIIDMYFESHQTALEYGVKYLDVYVLGWD